MRSHFHDILFTFTAIYRVIPFGLTFSLGAEPLQVDILQELIKLECPWGGGLTLSTVDTHVLHLEIDLGFCIHLHIVVRLPFLPQQVEILG